MAFVGVHSKRNSNSTSTVSIPIEMPNGRRPFNGKTALKRQITHEGQAPSVLKAERTQVREHFNALGNTAIGRETVL
jgi:hypothetical protein